MNNRSPLITIAFLVLLILACNLSDQVKPTSVPLPTITPILYTPAPAPTVFQTGNCVNKIGNISDQTYPDDTAVKAGENFVKTWELENAGTCTWMPDYALVFVANEQMQAVSPMPLGSSVKPGEKIEVSVSLTAPESAGKQRGIWMLQDSAGKAFGSGEKADQTFWVQVVVKADDVNPVVKVKPGDIILSLDKPYYSGVCPVSLKFNATITMRKPGDVEYKLEMKTAGSDEPAKAIASDRYTFKAGESLAVAYPAIITHTTSGWTQMSITSPDEVISNRINYFIQCK
jgi:hypothetical protein